MAKIKGYVIEYTPKDSNSRTLLNHTLFGRIAYRNYRGRKYAYYKEGMLHDTQFARLIDSKIFVTSLEDIDLEELEIFGKIEVTEENRDDDKIHLKTGEEHWKHRAEERGLMLRHGKK